MPCGPKEICPAGSWKPLEECKGLYKRNNETEVSSYHSVSSVQSENACAVGFIIILKRAE